MLFRQIVDANLSQYAYLIGCQKTGEAIVFDPQRDVDRYIEIASREKMKIVGVAETHIHSDFLSGARELAERVGACVYVSAEGGADWQSKWVGPYKHVLLHDGDMITLGGISIRAMHTPGHTPEHMSYLIFDRATGTDFPIGIISGDFVFAGDLGRPDLLQAAVGIQGTREQSAHALFASAQKFAQLPEFLQVWPGHGAGSAFAKVLGAVPQTTVGYEKAVSPILQLLRSEGAFVKDILAGQPEPPLYFARMKTTNRDGVDVLGQIPTPEVVTDLKAHSALWEKPGTVVVDTRAWTAFRDGHLPGAIYAPLGKMFPMVVGSYVKPQEKIVLVCEPLMSEEVIRDLVHIGYGHIIAIVPPMAIATAVLLEKTPEVSVKEAASELGSSFILDVRRLSENALGCVEGSCNIPYTRLSTKLAQVPKSKRVLVHCALGGRSAAATAMLRRLGYDAANIAGGFEAWKKEKLPTAMPVVGGCCGGRCHS